MRECWKNDKHRKESTAMTYNAEQITPVQEPVAWMVYTQEGQYAFVTDDPAQIHPSQRALPLYATPQRTWVGLTGEERNALLHLTITHSAIDFAKACEAKLKEKNT